MDCFDALPLSCLINEKFICVHGGISPSIDIMEDLNKVNRFAEPPKEGAIWYNTFINLFSDLLWCDPCENDEEALEVDYKNNEQRGCSYVFGYYYY